MSRVPNKAQTAFIRSLDLTEEEERRLAKALGCTAKSVKELKKA